MAAVTQQKEIVKNGEQALTLIARDIKTQISNCGDVLNQLQKKQNNLASLKEERKGIHFQQAEYIRQEKIRLQGEIDLIEQAELKTLDALKTQITKEWQIVAQTLQSKEQQLIQQQQQQFDSQRVMIEQAIEKIRQQQELVLLHFGQNQTGLWQTKVLMSPP